MKNKCVKDVAIECMMCLFCVPARKNKLKCAKGHELTKTSGSSCRDKNIEYADAVNARISR